VFPLPLQERPKISPLPYGERVRVRGILINNKFMRRKRK
jgi:hypothetical protein